jgi:hypothetical protein
MIWGLMIGDRLIASKTSVRRAPKIVRRSQITIIRPSRPPRIISRVKRRHGRITGRIVGAARRLRGTRIVGPARRQLNPVMPFQRRRLSVR